MAKPDSTAKKILVAVAWPYASGSRHLGHLAGAYLPPDIFARYHRALGDDVLMVSGSDVHGTPITVRADQEGTTPDEIVDRYHREFVQHWEDLGIRYDLYTTTGTDTHRQVTQDFFMKLLDNGYLYRETTDQFFDDEAGRFLPDRYVEGTCPYCGFLHARGDQCDNCGRTLDPIDLIDPKSKLTGNTPVLRQTEHYNWKLSAFQEPLLEWLRTRQGWRPHVLNFAIGMVEDGLHDRAFTRDLDWGIPLPVDDIGPGKTIYVWWEALMGYFSAPQEWAKLAGEPDAWKAWWEDPEAESYYFIGKDNIPFHAVYWPALLMAHGGLNLPTDVPANQFVTFGGEQASASRGIGRSIGWYTERFEPDALRYGLAINFPETSDTEITVTELVKRVNEELVATWGNLVNRVVTMTGRYFDGVVPAAVGADTRDAALIANVDATLDDVGDLIGAVKLRAGLRRAMAGAQSVNAYLNEREPWKTATDDIQRTGTTLKVALDAIAGIAVALYPYLPFTTTRVLLAFGVELDEDGPSWSRPEIAKGTRLSELGPLYAKMEPIDEEE
ncbi:MAG: methionine--tRNA ligase [Acidimicrobiia bacterium]|nr:MAG: methionine--tRNA ligase [Acidimicrobiia bacterium]